MSDAAATAFSHTVEVEGIGTFVFKKRTPRSQLDIMSNAGEIVKGRLDLLVVTDRAFSLATLEVLTLQAPDGWNLAEMDPVDPDMWADVTKVMEALRAAEARFPKNTPRWRQ